MYESTEATKSNFCDRYSFDYNSYGRQVSNFCNNSDTDTQQYAGCQFLAKFDAIARLPEQPKKYSPLGHEILIK